MRKNILSVMLLFLLLPTALLLGQASVSGRITGIVTDASGAVVQGATVTAASAALLKPKVQQSVSGGVYLLEDLPPGEYQITCAMPGFKGFAEKGLVLTAAFTATVNITLATGDAADTITVTGADPVVDVQSSNSPTTFDSTLTSDFLP